MKHSKTTVENAYVFQETTIPYDITYATFLQQFMSSNGNIKIGDLNMKTIKSKIPSKDLSFELLLIFEKCCSCSLNSLYTVTTSDEPIIFDKTKYVSPYIIKDLESLETLNQNLNFV